MTVQGVIRGEQTQENVPTRRGAYCYYSTWHLVIVNAVSRERTYGVYIYDACNNDAQVFPVPQNVRQGSCNNGDGSFPSGRYSLCPIIEPGHVPVGLPPGPACAAEAVASTALLATLQPATYDPRTATPLTATTGFASDFTQRLQEGTCVGDLTWTARAWTMRWSDGAVDGLPGSGQQGVTDTHTLAADPAATGRRQAEVTAIAHLHIHGDALDFAPDGSIVDVPRDADVDISNVQSSNGTGAAAVYTPPQVLVGAVAVAQQSDGSMGPASTVSTHATTLRGRLLELFAQAIVVRPGSEVVAGVVVGQGRTTTAAWTYLGGPTDAPPAEATPSGAGGAPTDPIAVQWNHAERLDASGNPVDETVPVLLTIRTVYSDGHAEVEQVRGAVAVSIYYPALQDAG